jgi:hypothetical protein
MVIGIVGIAGGCVLLALVLHFLVPAKGVKVPAVMLGTVGGFALGAMCGLYGAVIYGESVQSALYAGDHKPSPMPTKGAASAPKKKAAPPREEIPKKSGRPDGYPGPEEEKKPAPPDAPKD